MKWVAKIKNSLERLAMIGSCMEAVLHFDDSDWVPFCSFPLIASGKEENGCIFGYNRKKMRREKKKQAIWYQDW